MSTTLFLEVLSSIALAPLQHLQRGERVLPRTHIRLPSEGAVRFGPVPGVETLS
jgi:hypothetical protein